MSLCHIISNYRNNHTWVITHESHCNFGHAQTDQGLRELSLAGLARTYHWDKNMLARMAFTTIVVVVVAAIRLLYWQRWILLLFCNLKGEVSQYSVNHLYIFMILGYMKTHINLFLARGLYIRKGRGKYWHIVENILTCVTLNFTATLQVTLGLLSPFLQGKLKQKIYINALDHKISRVWFQYLNIVLCDFIYVKLYTH